MFIISISYTKPLVEIDALLAEHVSYLEAEFALGNFIASGRKNPRTGGVILSLLQDRSQVEARVRMDPFHQARVANYEITQFIPSKVAEGFEILQEAFEQQPST